MKQIYIEKTTQMKGHISFLVDSATINHLMNRRVEKSVCANIFLSQNIGKGPPGRICCSGEAINQAPDILNNLPNLKALNSFQAADQIYKMQITNHLIINKQQLFYTN
jgi:hypothetical protein